MAGIGSFLSNLENSGIGSGLPQGGSGGAGFLDSLLGGFQQANQAAQQNKMNQLTLGNAQRSSANQQLQQLGYLYKQHPEMENDPREIQRVQQLTKGAGLPNAITNTPGTPGTPGTPAMAPSGQMGTSDTTDTAQAGTAATPGTPGTPGGQAIDPTRFMQGRSINELSEAEKAKILAAPPGPTRNAMLAGLSDVTDEIRNAHAQLTSGEQVALLNKMPKIMEDVGKGLYPGQAGAAMLGSYGKQLADAGITDIDSVVADMKARATGPAAQAKINEYNAIVTDKKLQAAHMKQILEEEPAKFEMQIRTGYEKANAAEQNAQSGATRAQTGVTNSGINQQNANTRQVLAQAQATALIGNMNAHIESSNASMTNAQNKIQSGDVAGSKAASAALTSNINLMRKDLTDITKQISLAPQTGVDINAPTATDPTTGQAGPSLLSQATRLKSQLDAAVATKENANNLIINAPAKNLGNAMGNSSAQLLPYGSDQPNGGQEFYVNGQIGGSIGGSQQQGQQGQQPQQPPAPPPPANDLTQKYTTADHAGRVDMLKDPKLSPTDRTALSKIPPGPAHGVTAPVLQSWMGKFSTPGGKERVAADPQGAMTALQNSGLTKDQAQKVVDSALGKNGKQPVTPAAPAPQPPAPPTSQDIRSAAMRQANQGKGTTINPTVNSNIPRNYRQAGATNGNAPFSR